MDQDSVGALINANQTVQQRVTHGNIPGVKRAQPNGRCVLKSYLGSAEAAVVGSNPAKRATFRHIKRPPDDSEGLCFGRLLT